MHFLAAGGQNPPSPSPLVECPAKNASFFYVLPNYYPSPPIVFQNCIYFWIGGSLLCFLLFINILQETLYIFDKLLYNALWWTLYSVYIIINCCIFWGSCIYNNQLPYFLVDLVYLWLITVQCSVVNPVLCRWNSGNSNMQYAICTMKIFTYSNDWKTRTDPKCSDGTPYSLLC